MGFRALWIIGALAGLALTACLAAQTGARLPEDTGLAARYPGDVGIAADPNVIFAESFDHPDLDALAARWETVSERETMALVEDAPEGSGDPTSLRITHVGGRGTGGQLYRRLPRPEPVVFARWYVKFDPDCAKIHHMGTALGGYNPATPWPQGGAGELPRGDERFTVNLEPYGDDWAWDFYDYWQGMHVHGDGRYWGTPFCAGAPRRPVDRGRWICVETMITVNDPPDATNGEQAFWIDGQLWRAGGQVLSHHGPGFPRGGWTGGWWHPDAGADTTFEGFAWRSVPEFMVNFVWTYLYITDAPPGHVSRMWFDNIVLAREYIGPLG